MRFVSVFGADEDLDHVGPWWFVFVDADEPDREWRAVDVDGRSRLELFREAVEDSAFHSFPLFAMRMNASRVTTFTRAA